LTISLPQSVALKWDSTGNLTNDGTRSFAYSPENQLTNVTVAGAWKTDFVPDGLGRRRIQRDYVWSSGIGNWQITNELHFVYDGWLLIQVRNSNNVPLATYTRGLDLSGSLVGAGGIGGLLARSDTNGSTFYHADGAGNITGLMDGQQNMAARYMYGPFGKLAGMWGPMGPVNRMQFSSWPTDPSGLSHAPLRDYDPNWKWLTQDPIGESGGINLHGFVGNNPLSYVDPYGLSWWNPFSWFSSSQPTQPARPADPNSYGAMRADLIGDPSDNNFSGMTAAQVVGDIGMAVPKGLAEAAMMLPLGAEEGAYAAADEALQAAQKVKAAARCKTAANALRKHHSWPKYLGGAEAQDLVPLEKWLHDAYHSGLDKVLPRQNGTQYYESLTGAAQQQTLQDLADYTRAFDAKYGTQLYRAMMNEGFPLP
jgi:RHS repeat-associated protein